MENTNKDIFCFNNPRFQCQDFTGVLSFSLPYNIKFCHFFSIMKCLAHVILFMQRDKNLIKTKMRKNKMALDELLCELFKPQFKDFLFYFNLFYKRETLLVFFLDLYKNNNSEKCSYRYVGKIKI